MVVDGQYHSTCKPKQMHPLCHTVSPLIVSSSHVLSSSLNFLRRGCVHELVPIQVLRSCMMEILALLCRAHHEAMHLVALVGRRCLQISIGCHQTCIVSRSCNFGSVAVHDNPKACAWVMLCRKTLDVLQGMPCRYQCRDHKNWIPVSCQGCQRSFSGRRRGMF